MKTSAIALMFLVLLLIFACSDDDSSRNGSDLNIDMGSIYLGAGQGTKFVVHAPDAAAVAVRGSFNSWSESANPMTHTGNGIWTTTIASAQPGDTYKYYSSSFNGEWASDPYGRAFDNDNDNTIIKADSTYSWSDSAWTRPAKASLVIYEMHVEDFTRGDSTISSPNKENFPGVADKISYLKNLGVNAVQFMPIQEWSGGNYSWGYNTAAYFAMENSLATSGSENSGVANDQFRQLVDTLHQNGIAVILDVVYNHTFEDSPLWKIGSSTYYSTDPIDWGKKLDLTQTWTRQYVLNNLKYLAQEFHVDGFRFDSTENIDSTALLSIIDDMTAAGHGGLYYIFEEWDSAHNTAIQNYNSGQGKAVISSWGSLGYKNTIWSLVTNGSDGNMGAVTYYSKNAGWNYPAAVINFFSSHDEGTLAGNIGANKQQVRTATVHLLTSLGVPMLWMGDEVLRVHYGNHPPSGDGTDESNNETDWDSLISANSDLYGFFSALIKLRIAHTNLHLNVPDPDGSVDVFDWNTDWSKDGFVGYTYKHSGDNGFVVLVNYGTATNGCTVSFPVDGTWHLMCDGTNASSAAPGLNSSISVSGGSHSLDIAANTALIYMSASPLP